MQLNISLVELDRSQPAHLEIMYAVRSHPEVAKYLRGNPPATFDSHINYLQRVRGQKQFFVVMAGMDPCGYCQLTPTQDSIEIGMALHPDYSNKGIGSKALALLLMFVQKNDSAKKKPLILYVKKDNARAIALYNKFGFQTLSENEFNEFLMQRC